MGEISEFPLSVRAFIRLYRWRRIDPVPHARLRRPLRESRVGLVSSAGLVLPDQTPFDDTIKGGDWSFREIPADVDPQLLVETHRSESFSREGLEQDKNLVFPADRMRELERDGRIGALGRRILSFQGSITAPGRLLRETAPAAAQLFVDDGIEAALLVPV